MDWITFWCCCGIFLCVQIDWCRTQVHGIVLISKYDCIEFATSIRKHSSEKHYIFQQGHKSHMRSNGLCLLDPNVALRTPMIDGSLDPNQSKIVLGLIPRNHEQALKDTVLLNKLWNYKNGAKKLKGQF